MNRNIHFLLLIVMCLIIVSGCGSPVSQATEQPSLIYSETVTALPSATNTKGTVETLTPTFTDTSVAGVSLPTATQGPTPTRSRELPGLVKTSLEFYRNGKTYEIVVGYDLGEAFWRVSPRPVPPEDLDNARANGADLKWYGDIDEDGETEFIVSLLYCGVYCYESIQAYEYDPANDRYAVSDEFEAKYPAVETYSDEDRDGNPELVTANYGFCYDCGPSTVKFSAIEVLRYEQGKFVDVTSTFPDLIEQNADSLLESAKTLKDDQSAGISLASYLFDMYRLEKMSEARPIFGQVCILIKAKLPDPQAVCADFQARVEKAIEDFALE